MLLHVLQYICTVDNLHLKGICLRQIGNPNKFDLGYRNVRCRIKREIFKFGTKTHSLSKRFSERKTKKSQHKCTINNSAQRRRLGHRDPHRWNELHSVHIFLTCISTIAYLRNTFMIKTGLHLPYGYRHTTCLILLGSTWGKIQILCIPEERYAAE